MCSKTLHKDIHHNLGNGIMAIKGLIYQLKYYIILKDPKASQLLLSIESELNRIDKARLKCLQMKEEICKKV